MILPKMNISTLSENFCYSYQLFTVCICSFLRHINLFIKHICKNENIRSNYTFYLKILSNFANFSSERMAQFSSPPKARYLLSPRWSSNTNLITYSAQSNMILFLPKQKLLLLTMGTATNIHFCFLNDLELFEHQWGAGWCYQSWTSNILQTSGQSLKPVLKTPHWGKILPSNIWCSVFL